MKYHPSIMLSILILSGLLCPGIASADGEEGFVFDSDDTGFDSDDEGMMIFDDSDAITDNDLPEDADQMIFDEDDVEQDYSIHDPASDWKFNAPDTHYSGARFYQYTNESTSTVHVITDEDIQKHGFRSLADILRHVSGVQTQTSESQFFAISMRGLIHASNERTRILWFLNDTPINDAHNGHVFLDDTFPVDLIRRIEVVTGPQSSLYGPGAFLGTIHIYTKTADDIDSYGAYRVSFQNNLTLKASATAAYATDDKQFDIMGHVSGGTTQGAGLVADAVYRNYLMNQAAESIINGNVPDKFRRNQIDNNDQKNWYHVFINTHFNDISLNLGFSDIYAYADGSEITPYMNYGNLRLLDENQPSVTDNEGVINQLIPTKSYQFNRRQAYAELVYAHPFEAGVWLKLQASYRLLQYRHLSYHGLDDIEFNTDFNTLEHHINFNSDVTAKLGQSNLLSAGIALQYQYTDSGDLGKISDDGLLSTEPMSALNPVIWIRDEQHLWDDRIIINAGVRYDAWQALNHLQHDISWDAGFLGKFHSAFATRIRYGYGMNEPSFYQQNGFRYDFSSTNDLSKETIHQADLSFIITPLDHLSITAGGYFSYIKDLILLEYKHDATRNLTVSYPEQNSDARIYGGELELSATIKDNWTIYGYYHFLYSQRLSRSTSQDEEYFSDSRFADDSMHRIKLGFSYSNEYLTADLATFLVTGSPDVTSSYNPFHSKHVWRPTYHIPTYFIVQPSLNIKLPANFGININGSYAFSEDLTQSPSYRFYYEKEGVPVNRYTFLFSIAYPYQK